MNKIRPSERLISSLVFGPDAPMCSPQKSARLTSMISGCRTIPNPAKIFPNASAVVVLPVPGGPTSSIWAGVKLPGGQYRKRDQLARAHDTLRRIAAGDINSRQLPENAALLTRREGDTVAVTRTVFH